MVGVEVAAVVVPGAGRRQGAVAVHFTRSILMVRAEVAYYSYQVPAD